MPESVTQWLEELGLGQYAGVFAENDIDEEVLPDLEETDLEKIGVSLGHRKKILKAIQAFQQIAPKPTSEIAASGGEKAIADSSAVATPAHLVERIRASGTAMAGERKQVTVLFADIVGSTELINDVDPEVASQIMEPALTAMVKSVHRYEGTVARVQGDGIMALFGAPLSYEDHAIRACYSALDLQRTMQGVTEEVRSDRGILLQTRVGLNSGEVVIKSLGSDLRMDYEAIGLVVHLAARMESLAPPGSIQLTAQTAGLAEGFIKVESLGKIPVKGIDESVEVFELVGAGPARTRLQASIRRGATKFLGRDFELQALNNALNEMRAGRGQLVALTGEAGIGKSRLTYEFSRSHHAKGCLLLEATATSYGESADWSLLSTILKSYFGVDSADTERGIREKVAGKLVLLDESLKVALPALLSLFDVSSDDEAWTLLEPQQRHMRILNAVQEVLVRESRVQPVILAMEDLHWADRASMSFLDRFVDALPTNSILVIVNFRPEFGHHWIKLSSCTQLRLEALSELSCEALIDTLLGVDEGIVDLKHALIERSRGNPLFIEQVIREMMDAESLKGEIGSYSLTEPLNTIAIPASVSAIISARIDRLSPSTKQLLQTASVIGDDVPLTLLRAVVDTPEDIFRGELRELNDADFLYESELYPEEKFAFRHSVTREVAYSGLLKDARRAIHKQIGEVLGGITAERPVQGVEIIAHHFYQAQAWDEAFAYKLEASVKAVERFSYTSAATLGENALECAGKSSHSTQNRCRAHELLGDIWSSRGDIEKANTHYDEASVLCPSSDVASSVSDKRHNQTMVLSAGANIAAYVHGNGADCIFILVPDQYSMVLYQSFIQKLCHDYRIVFIDARGTGSSDPTPEGVSVWPVEAMAEDVHNVIQALDVAPVVAVGLSRGGIMAIKLATKYPDLFKKLVLVDAPVDDSGPSSPYPRPAVLLQQLEDAFARNDHEQAARVFAHSIFSESEMTDYKDYVDGMVRECLSLSLDWIRDFHQGTQPDLDIKPLLPEVCLPTLIVHGTGDRRVPFAAAEFLNKQIAGSTLYAFGGSGHLPIITAAGEFCTQLDRFIRET